jgi:hypothetical protein
VPVDRHSGAWPLDRLHNQHAVELVTTLSRE